MSDTPFGWVPDSGLDAHSVASMTPEEAKEYLALVIRFFVPSELPSLAWLRRATGASQESSSHSNSERGDRVTLNGSRSPYAGNPTRKREKALGLLHGLVRRAPVSFEAPAKRSSVRSARRPRKAATDASSRRKVR